MKRLRLPLFCLILLSIVVFIGATMVIGYLCVTLVTTMLFPTEFDRNEVAYSASAHIDGFDFDVTLFRNHPMLAEYRKLVRVRRGDALVVEREFTDTGGLASFYLLRQGHRIMVLDGLRDGFVIDGQSGEVSKVDLDALPQEIQKHDFGRFMFVNQPERTYKWVVREEYPPSVQ